jgi:hypothetical protein
MDEEETSKEEIEKDFLLPKDLSEQLYFEGNGGIFSDGNPEELFLSLEDEDKVRDDEESY